MPEWSKHFPGGALRPAAAMANSGVPKGPYFHGALRPRRAGDCRQPQDQEIQLVRPVRWAAWSDNGWAPMPPARVDKLILSNTNYHYADKGPWNDRIKFRPGKKGLAQLVEPNMETLVHQGAFASARRKTIARIKEIFSGHRSQPATSPAAKPIRDMDFHRVQSQTSRRRRSRDRSGWRLSMAIEK